jgi:hypothetical protein
MVVNEEGGGIRIRNNKYNRKDITSRKMIIMNCRKLNSKNNTSNYILNMRTNGKMGYLPNRYYYSDGSEMNRNKYEKNNY